MTHVGPPPLRCNESAATAFSESGFAQFNQADVAGTLRASGGANGAGSETLVAGVVGINGHIIGRSPQHGGNGLGIDMDVSPTLTTSDRHAVAFDLAQMTCPHNGSTVQMGKPVPTLSANSQMHVLSFQSNAGSQSCMSMGDEITPTLTTSANKVAVFDQFEVRRLMPMECERVQGFKDGYTLVEHRGRLAKDTPRYKALGNSMAVPVMAWIGRRIDGILKGV